MGIPSGVCEPQRGSGCGDAWRGHRGSGQEGPHGHRVLMHLRVGPQKHFHPTWYIFAVGRLRSLVLGDIPRLWHGQVLPVSGGCFATLGGCRRTVTRQSRCAPTYGLRSPGKVTSPLIKGFNNIYLVGVNNGPQDAVRIN